MKGDLLQPLAYTPFLARPSLFKNPTKLLFSKENLTAILSLPFLLSHNGSLQNTAGPSSNSRHIEDRHVINNSRFLWV